jgi:hypothetical protein
MNEALLHEQVCNYLKLQYPKVLFRTDMGGVRLTPGQAARVARTQAGRAWPDIFIAEPRHGSHGLFIELKRDGTRLKNKKGLYATAHLEEQATMLGRLGDLGYFAEFAVGFDQCKGIIDNYLHELLDC